MSREEDARVQVWTAACGKPAEDRLRKAFEAIPGGNQDVPLAPVLQPVHHSEPESGALVPGNPEARNLADAVPRR